VKEEFSHANNEALHKAGEKVANANVRNSHSTLLEQNYNDMIMFAESESLEKLPTCDVGYNSGQGSKLLWLNEGHTDTVQIGKF
jgi:hypothetical protein